MTLSSLLLNSIIVLPYLHRLLRLSASLSNNVLLLSLVLSSSLSTDDDCCKFGLLLNLLLRPIRTKVPFSLNFVTFMEFGSLFFSFLMVWGVRDSQIPVGVFVAAVESEPDLEGAESPRKIGDRSILYSFIGARSLRLEVLHRICRISLSGLVPLLGSNNESWCQGWYGLASRSAEYYKQGLSMPGSRRLCSTTNELEQASALKYLCGWLNNHPKYGSLASPGLAVSLYYADGMDLKTGGRPSV